MVAAAMVSGDRVESRRKSRVVGCRLCTFDNRLDL